MGSRANIRCRACLRRWNQSPKLQFAQGPTFGVELAFGAGIRAQSFNSLKGQHSVPSLPSVLELEPKDLICSACLRRWNQSLELPFAPLPLPPSFSYPTPLVSDSNTSLNPKLKLMHEPPKPLNYHTKALIRTLKPWISSPQPTHLLLV